jgi:hypothetical protein
MHDGEFLDFMGLVESFLFIIIVIEIEAVLGFVGVGVSGRGLHVGMNKVAK